MPKKKALKLGNLKVRRPSPVIILCAVFALMLASFAVANAATPEGDPLSGELGARTLSSGNYYLAEDATGNITVQDGAEVTLDLNGHVLKSATGGASVIAVGTIEGSTAKLTLVDSAPSATHSGEYASLPAGGVIAGGSGSMNGGGVNNWGALTMNGGTITGNALSGSNATGGGVYNNVQGTFTMNGGEISGNTTQANGGGVSNKGSFVMNAGKISGNTASAGVGQGAGGGVYTEGIFEMYGGEISGNTSGTFGGGVDNSHGFDQYTTIGGTAVIKGNARLVSGGQQSDNLYNEAGKYVTIATGDKAPVAGKMSIGVTLAGTTGQVTTACGADYHSYFISDNTTYGVYNKVESASNYVYVGNCAEIVETGAIYGGVNEAIRAAEGAEMSSATIKMLSDSMENVSTEGLDFCTTLTLDLNGHVLKSNSAGKSVVDVNEGITLTIKDSNPTAVHSGDYASLPAGGVITGAATKKGMSMGQEGGAGITNGGTLNLYAGTITGNSSAQVGGGGGVCNNTASSTFNMYGGSIAGNTAVKAKSTRYGHGGGVYNAGTFNMYAGKISGNTANGQGGGVYNAGEASMTVGGTAVVAENVLSGGSKGNVYLPDGKTIAISTTQAFASGASIGVTTQTAPAAGAGVQFTSNGSKADEAFFFADNSAYADKYNAGTGSGAYLELVLGYAITCAGCMNGSVSTGSQTVAYAGETVTVAATPDEGYQLDAVKVAKTDGGVDVTSEVGYSASSGTFTMPAYDVTVSATFKQAHTHSWSYAASKSSSTLESEDTITATCQGEGTCDYAGTDKGLTIQAPDSSTLTYDGNSHDASFGEATTFLGGSLPAISYLYKATASDEYATATSTKAAGYYKASFTVGEGTAAKTASVEYTVAKRKLTITGSVADGKAYDGNTTAKAYPGEMGGAVGGDNVTVTVASATFDNKNAGNGHDVTIVYGVSGTAAGNYDAPDSDTTIADIGPRQLSVEGTTVADKAYDGATAATATKGTDKGIVSGDDVTVTIASATFDSKNAGTGKTVTVVYAISGADTGNYAKPINGQVSASITQKAVSVAAEDKSSRVGSALVALTYSAGTLASGDSWAGALETDADSNAAGEYEITQGTLGVNDGNSGANYAISFTKGTYIVRSAQTVYFPDVAGGKVSRTYGDAAFQKLAMAMTTVSYSSDNTAVATVDPESGEVTIIAAGTATITATAEETSVYEQGSASYTLTVSPKQLTVTGTQADGKDYDGTTVANVNQASSTLAGKVGEDDVSIATWAGSFASKDVANGIEVTISYTLKGADAGNYTVANSTTNADIERRTLTITPVAGQSKVFGSDDPVLAYTYADNVDGEVPAFIGTLSRAAGENVVAGGYAITLGTLTLVNNGSFKADNYVLALCETPAAFAITQKQVTVTADDKSMVLGDALPEFTATVAGTLGSDKVAYEFEPIDPKVQGAYAIVVKGEASQGNYAVSFAQGTLSVNEQKAADPAIIKTGDDAAPTVAIVGIVAVAAGVIALATSRRRRQR